MPATFHFCQDSGSLTSGHGTTRSGFGADTHYCVDLNLKNADDCSANSGTVYSAAPIQAGTNSYTMYPYAKFTGTFNSISSGLWAHTAGTLGSNLSLFGTVTSTYATPSTTTNAALTTDMTTAILIGAGAAVLFSTTGPEDGSPVSSITSAGYSQYLPVQLVVGSSASPGDTASITYTFQFLES